MHWRKQQLDVPECYKDKTELIVFGPKDKRLKVSAQLQSLMLKSTNQAINLDVFMVSKLNLNSHIKKITKSAYYHLTNISRITGFMSQQDLEKLVHAFIFSRLDYCNRVFTGLCKQSIRKPQEINPVLRSLHWLPVQKRKCTSVFLFHISGTKSLKAAGLMKPSETFRDLQRPSETLRDLQRPSETLRDLQRPSETFRDPQRPSALLNPDWRLFCLLLPLIEQYSRM